MNDLFLTLEAAKNDLKAQVSRGVRCPCCGQYAKVYRRKLNSGMVRSLITIYRRGGMDWVHVPTLLEGVRCAREEGKLRNWNLLQESDEPRADGGKSGWWRVTGFGVDFVNDRARVPKYATFYDNALLKLDGPLVGIRDCLGSKFNYFELMGMPIPAGSSSLAAGMIAKNTGTSSVAGSPATSMSD
jgi:hypothetical protein